MRAFAVWVVSRDAQFMEDVFDGGERNSYEVEVVIGLPDEDDEDATEETPSRSDKDNGRDADTFKSAMNSDERMPRGNTCDSWYDSLLKNKTWEVVPPP
ncbi:Gag-pol Polyprotein [Phytophthora cinnamomi]|uniref:Gag-pol Polyprotein n=1 Tax=Phytophthora cinnamomi TaxID=4785 RepID=UPI00355A0120|nr:Gag-pol Polyprotein [Phytophthora cinnamomi]